MEIIVCRGSSFPGECREDDSALSFGDNISEALLCTEEAALVRGRIEIDSSYTNRLKKTIDLSSTSFVQPGKLIKIVEGTEEINGLVQEISINFNVSNGSINIGSSITAETNLL